MTRPDMDMHRFFPSVCMCLCAACSIYDPSAHCKPCGGFSLTLPREIAHHTLWLQEFGRKKKKQQKNDKPLSKWCTLCIWFHGFKFAAKSLWRSLYCKYSIFNRQVGNWKTQVSRQRGKHAVSGNNALFYNDAFGDQLLNFTLANTASATQYLEISMKYKLAPTNLSLYASSLCVLHYTTQRSGTTYHSFIN